MSKHRDRPIIGLTLSPEAVGVSDALAAMRGMSRSALIEHLIREEGFRHRLDFKEPGRRERRKRSMPKPDGHPTKR